MTIEKLTEATSAELADINAINQQLHEGRVGTLEELQAIVSDKNINLIVARDGEKIVGIVSLYTLQKLGKRSAYLEDVVVDGGSRGQGIGERLVRHALSVAKQEGIRSVYLTSREVHAAGHKLYKKVGFGIKDTTVFKYSV